MNSWTDFRAATVGEILDWAEPQPWVRAMASCGQDAIWHAEGDVWTHTRMVAQQLEQLPEWADLDADSRLKLVFTALFHDCGKPATTIINPETGRTHSPKHALVGMEIGRQVFREIGCPLAFREEVLNLVRYHGRPPFILEKPDPANELIALSWQLNHRLLYLFALADTRGRHTQELARPEEVLQIWKMIAEENNCFTQPYPFANDHARFLFYRGQLSSLHYTPQEDYGSTVTLMSGLPGTGKNTWLEQNRPNLPVVSLDDIRTELDLEPTDDQGLVMQAAHEKCREHLRAKRNFAFNATNTMRLTRSKWIERFAAYGARVEIVYLEPPLSVVLRQNKSRPAAVPQRVIDRLVSKLEPPTCTEAHAVQWIG
jgi:putative nucleotidyltransferase with HDIG domain